MAKYNIILNPSRVTWDLSQATKSIRVNIESDDSSGELLAFDGSSRTEYPLSYTHYSDEKYITVSGANISSAGTYTIQVKGTATVNYAGYIQYDAVDLTFTAVVTDSPSPIQVEKPRLLANEFYYTGNPITIQASTSYWNEWRSQAYTLGGETSKTAVGTYTITVTCKSGYEFTDHSTSANYTWSIINRKVAKPTLSTSTLYYSGSSQRITDYLSGFDSTKMITSGQTTAINLGSYTLTVSCRTGYLFTDGTSTANYSWVITKRSQTIHVSTTSMTLPTGGTQSTAVSGAQTTVKVNAIAPNIANASVSGSTIVVRAGNITGSANIYIYAEETDYYFESNVECISVTVYLESFSNIRVRNSLSWSTV